VWTVDQDEAESKRDERAVILRRLLAGRYIIADRPMTEEEWIRERATVIDVSPEKADE
jgi:hypothetical protein